MSDIGGRPIPEPSVTQKTLAEFGRFALQCDDLDEVLDRACRSIYDAMGHALVKIVELQADGRLYIRQYCGFEPDLENRWLRPGRGSSAGHALMTETPTISHDAANDNRFDRAAVVADENITSLINVLIPDGTPMARQWYGVLEVDSASGQRFAVEETEFLTLYANLIGAAVTAIEGRARAARHLAETDALLRELQHRVKNDLAVVTSFVRIQSRRAVSDETKQHLKQIAARIDTLRQVHESFYARGRMERRIDCGPFLCDLAQKLIDFHGAHARGIVIHADTQSGHFDADTTMPMGLLVNEFVTNSLKHAFGEGGGRIDLIFVQEGGQGRLTLRDDGCGLPPDARRKGGTGLTIIEGLAAQLDGTAEWGPGPGTELNVIFPLRDHRNATVAPAFSGDMEDFQ